MRERDIALNQMVTVESTLHILQTADHAGTLWRSALVGIFRCLLCALTTAPFLINAYAQVPVGNASPPAPSLQSLTRTFELLVPQHMLVPAPTVTDYAALLDAALKREFISGEGPAFVVLVDRNPVIQALLIFMGNTAEGWTLVGATAISTGLPGRYEHFKTPLGVFDHSRENPDFRAEGTKNKLGIRGYGNKGGRIYDFGWVMAPRGWGDGHMGELRLQMHSTDRDLLERRLGTAQSESCVRMPAQLNEFLDLHAILDQDYERVIEAGTHPWVLRSDRQPTPWSGRYLVVVESDDVIRPDWAVTGHWQK